MKITLRRLFGAVAWLTMLGLVVTIAMGLLKQSTNNDSQAKTTQTILISSPFFWLILLALVVVAIQTYVNYSKDWYNPDLALKYQDAFESERVVTARTKATKQYKEKGKYNHMTKEVEVVLDIFEDIGFYVKHEEMSREVAHHHFYHWARGYIQTARGYIERYQIDDPTAYESCEYLLKEITEVEANKVRRRIEELVYDEKEIADFMEEESAD